jgi:hypothetical protein
MFLVETLDSQGANSPQQKERIMSRQISLLGCVVCAALLLSPFASAETILTTMDSDVLPSMSGDLNSSRWRGSAFQSGSAGATLRSITLVRRSDYGADTDWESLVVSFRSDASGPGATLESYGFASFGANDTVSFGDFNSEATLSAGTKYWVVLEGGTASTILYHLTSPTDNTGSMAGYTSLVMAGSGYSDGAGQAWNVSDFGGRPFMDLNTTSIPEPATMSLLALGGIAMLRRRKKQKGGRLADRPCC